MASALNKLYTTAARGACRIWPQVPSRASPRPFHTSRLYRDESSLPPTTSKSEPTNSTSAANGSELEEKEATAQSLDATPKYVDSEDPDMDPDALTDPTPKDRAALAEFKREMAAMEREMPEDDYDGPSARTRPGFMAMGEEDEMDDAPDDVFEGNDMSSLGHGILEEHREIREYARIAAWELPLLSSKLPVPYHTPKKTPTSTYFPPNSAPQKETPEPF